MKKIKIFIRHCINSIKFCKIKNSDVRNKLLNAGFGLKIEANYPYRLTLKGSCPKCRNNCFWYVRENCELTIGDNVFFNNNFQIACRKKISIGDGCIFGPNTSIFDHNHLFDEEGISRTLYDMDEVKIGNNVWIGAGVIILQGTIIGDNSIIGAGCVVKGIVPPNSILIQRRENIIKALHGNNKHMEKN